MEGKKKVFTLKETKDPCYLIAISCAENIHKLAWLIHSQLGISLTESPGLRVKESESNFIEFPVHKGVLHNTHEEFTLIKNKMPNSILLKTHPNIDYILKISGHSSAKKVKETVGLLKKVSGVQAAIQIEAQKGKGFAVFDLL